MPLTPGRNGYRMNHPMASKLPGRPERWKVVLAFSLVYVAWGTTYLAIRKGVEVFPPGLFGGARIGLAGLALLSYLALRRQPLRMPLREFLWTGALGLLFFAGGNGFVTFGERSVVSGVASVLVATTPLWMALLETAWPWGERLRLRGWLGLFVGLAGVIVLLGPSLRHPADLWQDAGPLLVLASAMCWSLGSCVLHHRRLAVPHLAAAGYQMLVGGSGLFLAGLLLGEAPELARVRCTPVAVYAFFHLLVVGSLIGFVAYNWLLGHVSPTLAGTYAYVNPAIAILAGWLLNSEPLTLSILGGMGIILAGVALVRGGSVPGRRSLKSVAQAAPGNKQSPSKRRGRAVDAAVCSNREGPAS